MSRRIYIFEVEVSIRAEHVAALSEGIKSAKENIYGEVASSAGYHFKTGRVRFKGLKNRSRISNRRT